MRGLRNLTKRHRRHPDGYSLNLRMCFADMEQNGWTATGLHLLTRLDGHTIRAEFGRQDGFPCWRYVTGTPSGKTLGTFPDAASAAGWIARRTVNA